MQSPSDAELLAEWTARRSEAAFARLVERYVALVHSAARRQVSDPHLAEEITQAVFILLARKAGSLARQTVLAGWLCRTAHFAARDALKAERRRLHREQLAAHMDTTPDAAWQQLAPLLDEAVAQLREADRNAIVLRYYEQQSLDEVGAALGIGADAAQKRVARALDKLRDIFTKRGVTLTGAAIAGAVSANAVQAVPMGLAAKISAAALLAGTITTTTIATMNWLNAKAIPAVLASALAAGTITYLVQQGEVNHLRSENQNLLTTQERIAGERETALSTANANREELERLRKNQSELLRLRSEVGMLRRETGAVDRLREQNHPRTTSSVVAKSQGVPSQNEERYACINNLRRINGAMLQCALENRLAITNVLTLEQILPYCPEQQLPRCPSGGTYTLTSADADPTCSIPGHALPRAISDEQPERGQEANPVPKRR